MVKARALRAAIYVRVSTEEQTVENQERALRRYCKANGWKVEGVYRDGTTDHSAAEVERAGFSELLKHARVRRFDLVVVWALDRLTRRGIGPLFSILDSFKAMGVGWRSLQEPWASDAGPASEVMLAILAWASKQERLRISERTKAGIARRRALGHPVGRPKGRKDRKKRVRRWRKRPQTGRPG